MRNFRLQVIIRITAITATVLIAIWLFEYSGSHMAAFMLALGTLVQIFSLTRYVDKTNRDLSRFLNSVRYSDFSQSFTGAGRGKSFATLGKSFAEVMDDFREARAETEEQHRFLQTIVQHVGTGLISFDRAGDVGLINNAAKRLFQVQHVKNIHSLEEYSSELVAVLRRLRAGERAIVKVVHGDEMQELVLSGTEFRVHGDIFTLVAIQDIQSELEEKELQAWLKLTRVLTHEIMNSITPIASLASTAQEILDNHEFQDDENDVFDDIRGAIQTIERRSQGLLHFVQAYRSMTHIPRPNLKIFRVSDLFESVSGLFRVELEASGIQLEILVDPPALDLTADPDLVEQILINLIRNALQMVDEETSTRETSPRITISSRMGERGRPIIQVSDNGPGIEPEALDKIFVPFLRPEKRVQESD